ncbi:ketose-bisphosphate aldolase [Streptococcus sobrinus W1703]|uniref:Ketose-bisphosphate aldolase n=1 Tax=Streptococcus sobrinus W1703 TaxID=1227275 RepID=U2J7E6_9STRE|nr:ketose-bisphosphate aldolase [Streptococcus sobrinus W1703]
MLINMEQMLVIAKENKFAVGAYNISNLELARIVIEQCEEDNAPAIIEVHPTEVFYCKDDFFAYVLQRIKNSKVPFVLHLDHGDNLDSVARAIHNGFSSVMIDGSLLSWDENVDITRKTVEMCHRVGVSVEGELGTIGQTGTAVEDGLKNGIYTKPEDAKRFVEGTGVDILAFGIGTAHGIYPKNVTPEIRIDILKDIMGKSMFLWFSMAVLQILMNRLPKLLRMVSQRLIFHLTSSTPFSIRLGKFWRTTKDGTQTIYSQFVLKKERRSSIIKINY